MSRCFPFPPPGYEKKARTEDADSLKKEKSKEKKHKKEKRDRERSEGKEKRSKDRSDGKHKEKKDKKERHRDKIKDKGETSGANKSPLLSSLCNGEKGSSDTNKQKVEILGANRSLLPSDGCNGEKRSADENQQRLGNGDKYIFDNGEKRSDDKVSKSNNHVADADPEDSKFVREMGRRVVDNEVQAIGSNKGMLNLVTNAANTCTDKRDKNGSVISHIPLEEMPPLRENQIERRKENTKENDFQNHNQERDKKSYKNQKDPEKQKTDEIMCLKMMDHYKLNQSENGGGSLCNHNMKSSNHIYSKSASIEGISKKRKDFETNEFLHADEVKKPSKLRNLSSSHPLVENGRQLESGQPSVPSSDRNKKLIGNTLKVESNEHKVNGELEGHHQPSFSTSKPPLNPQAKPVSNQVSQLKPKKPHRDTKYLGRVLTVPQLDDISELDDQEWLFGSKDSQEKRRLGLPKATYTPPEVWSKAVMIESADVCALPYVIPF